MRRLPALIFLVALPLLGCSGTETDDLGGGTSGGTGALACAMTGCEIAKLAVTTAMPSGSATYLGRASVSTNDANGALKTTASVLQMNANFATGQIGLSLSDVRDGTYEYLGQSTGSANITGSTFSGAFAGALTPAIGAAAVQGAPVFHFDGTLTGQFRGDTARALNGDFTQTGGGGMGGDAYGRFFANRQ